jgi:DNA-binding transcriptional MerR regulator
MQRYLKIGEVAGLLGVSTKTIRHYQRIGLLEEPARSEAGYRLYGGDDLLHLLRIRRLTALGLPLARIRELLAAPGDREPLRQALGELREELAAEIRRLSERQAAVDRLLAEAGGAGLEEPGRPPEAVDAALLRLRGKLTGIAPETLDRGLDLDRRLLGLLYELELPAGATQRLGDVVDRLAADPAPLAGLLPLFERWIGLADADIESDSPEVEALADELAAAFPPELAAGAGLVSGPLSGVMGELMQGTLSPAQSRFLVLLRERLAERGLPVDPAERRS